jgi:cellulose synthase/poly-beta-1,6-N-acetylglucosamine synthase-like glycosyltransferase
MVDMCKGKRKYDYEAPMTSSLSDCTWLEKSESFVSQQRGILPCTFFLSLDSSLSYLSCHSSFLFLFFFLSFFHSHSFILIFFSFFTFLLFFLSFFSILILFYLFLPLLTSFRSSQLLSFLHAYNLKF